MVKHTLGREALCLGGLEHLCCSPIPVAIPGSRTMAVLQITSGDSPDEYVQLEHQETTIGRRASCDIVVATPIVSRNHARIVAEEGRYYLEDLNSSNGTYCNQTAVQGRCQLSDGDTISIDKEVQFRFWDSHPVESSEAQDAAAAQRTAFSLNAESDFFDRATVVRSLDAQGYEVGQFNANPVAKLRAILEMTRRVGTSLELSDVLPEILDGLFHIFPMAERGYVLLFDDATQDVVPYSAKIRDAQDDGSKTLPSISRTIARRVMQNGQAILTSDAIADERFRKIASVHDFGIRSMMAAPLLGLDHRPIGVIQLDRQDPIMTFSVDDLEVLVMAATLANSAIAYTELHNKRLDERQQADARFQQLLECAPDAIVVVNYEGQITLVNAQAESLFGYHRGDLLDQSIDTLIPRWNHTFESKGSAPAGPAPNAQPMGIGKETIGLRSDKTQFPVEISFSPLDTEAGTLVFTVVRDMTEIKRIQRKSRQAQRLATIGETMAALAHESRNALQRSQSCLEILELEVADNPKAVELIGRLQNAQDHLHRMHEEIREYAMPIRPERRSCNLVELLNTVWDHLQPIRSTRQAVLHVHRTTIDLRCEVDPFQIQQVFRNILENSFAACSENVEISVKWGEEQLENGDAVGIRFRDNGPGLSEEQRRRIFEPFFTTKTHGSGLGMAISKRIVDAHSGHIHVGEKRNTGGTDIVVWLPRRAS